MGKITAEQVDRVRDIVAAIPRGSVSTYGAIAAAAGLTTPRSVAWILRVDGDGLPWHRVIRADGRPAAPVRERQLPLLEQEGVPMRGAGADAGVCMRRAFHRP